MPHFPLDTNSLIADSNSSPIISQHLWHYYYLEVIVKILFTFLLLLLSTCHLLQVHLIELTLTSAKKAKTLSRTPVFFYVSATVRKRLLRIWSTCWSIRHPTLSGALGFLPTLLLFPEHSPQWKSTAQILWIIHLFMTSNTQWMKRTNGLCSEDLSEENQGPVKSFGPQSGFSLFPSWMGDTLTHSHTHNLNTIKLNKTLLFSWGADMEEKALNDASFSRWCRTNFKWIYVLGSWELENKKGFKVFSVLCFPFKDQSPNPARSQSLEGRKLLTHGKFQK